MNDRTKADKEGYRGEKKTRLLKMHPHPPSPPCHKQPLCSRCVTGRNVGYVTSEST